VILTIFQNLICACIFGQVSSPTVRPKYLMHFIIFSLSTVFQISYFRTKKDKKSPFEEQNILLLLNKGAKSPEFYPDFRTEGIFFVECANEKFD
jgi:hypothetical protein